MHAWGMLGKLFIFAIESDFHSRVNPIQTNDEYRSMQQQICSKYERYECEAKILQTNWIADCCILVRGKWKVNVAKIDNNNLKRVCYHALLQLL